MVIMKIALPRRTFLRGVGVTFALPFIDAMVPALSRGSASAASLPKTRYGFIYVPHGHILDQWIPETEGADFNLRPIMKPLEPFRQQLTVISNLVGAARRRGCSHGCQCHLAEWRVAETHRGRGREGGDHR